MSRALLTEAPSPALNDVRKFFENMIQRADDEPKPAHHGAREVVANAAALAMLDAQTTGRLDQLTRAELDRMWKNQRKDGAWAWTKCGWPPFEVDDYYGALLAALAVGYAPDGYAQAGSAQAGIAKLRDYFSKTPAPDLHHRAWLLWAAARFDGLMTDEQKKTTIAELLALQHADGGWSMESLGSEWTGHDGDKADPGAPSDGYGAGLVIFALRQAGVPAKDEAIQRGIRWLSSNQRVSGRWFTRSLNGVPEDYISDAATAFAVLALKACD